MTVKTLVEFLTLSTLICGIAGLLVLGSLWVTRELPSVKAAGSLAFAPCVGHAEGVLALASPAALTARSDTALASY